MEHKDHLIVVVVVYELVGSYVPVPLPPDAARLSPVAAPRRTARIIVVIVVDENDRFGPRLVLDPLRTAVALVMTTPPA